MRRDNSQQGRAEGNQLRLERRFRLLVEHSADGFALFSVKGLFTYVGSSAERILGRPERELLGRPCLEHVHPEDLPRLRETGLLQAKEPGSVYRVELRYQLPDSSYRWLENTSVNHLNDDGINAIVTTFRDITERRRLEEERRLSEERFRAILRGVPAVICISSTTGTILEVNDRLCTFFGYKKDQLIGRRSQELGLWEDPAVRDRMMRLLHERGTVRNFEASFRRNDGETREALLNVELIESPSGGAEGVLLFMVEDVTDRKRAEAALRESEEQLRQSQKMEAVGLLAGGVAHDFNNLLTAILGYGELLAKRFKAGDPAWEEVQQVRRAGERAAALTRQLLAFSRKQVLIPKILDLGYVVQGLSRLLERLIGEDIRVEVLIARDLWKIEADPGQMEQVLMNLAVNARDAMPNGGKLLFELSNLDLDEGYCREHPVMKLGPCVLLVVSDSGKGMTGEVQKQIFEPFFTTKEKGRGTGLGLSTVYGIVTQSGGLVEVESEPGRGSAFKIYLPRVKSEVEAGHPLVTGL